MQKKTQGNMNFEKASDIQGFDIKLNKEKVSRIDRLVDNYEQKIASRLDEEYETNTKRSDRIADKVAAFGGSWTFIILFGLFLVLWMLINILPFLPYHFDPKPFILLNLILSFVAAFQAPLIMMSQNRQAARDKHESIIDFAINYKAEKEIDDMQRHLHHMEGELKEIKELLLHMQQQNEPESKE
ncbi:MAG: DUF1003 domain-containing protein [Clostridium sp.]|uniref:DUF1003 domain-containing protein n=1 Tax=Clostridium sp. TaxID=1506 RepID=UPI00290CD1CF|nr:DUF1003 domain-containing protein [Clostridium sp.]MDU7337879.1 DUF1003 domain-containing protein [Clostridium sp.]